jgi:hypothetical protein
MNPSAAPAPTYTPPGLVFDERSHRYTLDGRDLLSVTHVLRMAGLVDLAFFTEADRVRGTAAHAAIEQINRGVDPFRQGVDGIAGAFVVAYRRFLAESPIRIDAAEERLADATLMCAGTLDLRGQFLDAGDGVGAGDRIDILDVKTGVTPPWVGYQTAAYVRLLPPIVARRCRRWCLTLREDATYRLTALTKRSDEAVFLAALTIAQAKRGWV